MTIKVFRTLATLMALALITACGTPEDTQQETPQPPASAAQEAPAEPASKSKVFNVHMGIAGMYATDRDDGSCWVTHRDFKDMNEQQIRLLDGDGALLAAQDAIRQESNQHGTCQKDARIAVEIPEHVKYVKFQVGDLESDVYLVDSSFEQALVWELV